MVLGIALLPKPRRHDMHIMVWIAELCTHARTQVLCARGIPANNAHIIRADHIDTQSSWRWSWQQEDCWRGRSRSWKIDRFLVRLNVLSPIHRTLMSTMVYHEVIVSFTEHLAVRAHTVCRMLSIHSKNNNDCKCEHNTRISRKYRTYMTHENVTTSSSQHSCKHRQVARCSCVVAVLYRYTLVRTN